MSTNSKIADTSHQECAVTLDRRTANEFIKLKRAVYTASVLQVFNPMYQIYITTDASKNPIGAVLEQEFLSGRHPVSFTSTKLNNAENRSPAQELELLSIVDTLRAWRCPLTRENVHSAHRSRSFKMP